jgi:hypothetical protein
VTRVSTHLLLERSYFALALDAEGAIPLRQTADIAFELSRERIRQGLTVFEVKRGILRGQEGLRIVPALQPPQTMAALLLPRT